METFKEDFRGFLQANGTLLTSVAAILVFGLGVTLVNDPSKWWYTLIAIIGLGFAAFLFLNARVVIKSTLSIFSVFIIASYGFKLGTEYDTTGFDGSVWMSTTLAAFFLNLTLSFIWPGVKSRWGVATLSAIVGFATTMILPITGLTVAMSSVIANIVSVLFFGFSYWFKTKKPFKHMPELIKPDNEFFENVINAGWGAWSRKHSVIVWNEHRAYNLVNVDLSQKFGANARKKPELTYQGKKIGGWLFNLSYKVTPFHGTRNADIMTVLLDTRNGNGKLGKVIGVAIPDSKKQIPVGIYPAANTRNMKKFLDDLDENFKDYVRSLNAKQLEALDSFLPDENTE